MGLCVCVCLCVCVVNRSVFVLADWGAFCVEATI